MGGGFGGFGSAAGFGSSGSSVLSYIQEPPDYSLINDSNVVVAFKNLSKKDSTTKAKALEDLQSTLITSDREVEDAIVEAWVRLLPICITCVGGNNVSSGQALSSLIYR